MIIVHVATQRNIIPVCFRRHGVRVGAPRRCQWLLHEPGNPPLDDSADGKGRRDTEWRAGPRSHPPPRQNHLVPRWTCSGTHAGVSYGRDHRRRWCNTAINVRLLLVSVVRKGCVVAYTLLCSLSRVWVFVVEWRTLQGRWRTHWYRAQSLTCPRVLYLLWLASSKAPDGLYHTPVVPPSASDCYGHSVRYALATERSEVARLSYRLRAWTHRMHALCLCLDASTVPALVLSALNPSQQTQPPCWIIGTYGRNIAIVPSPKMTARGSC